jgi:carbonic anhydrase
MSVLARILENNRSFAATGARTKVPEIPFIPNEQLYVITCIDPRVDPAVTLGVDLGDAIVARNVGGRVTAAVLQDLAWISYLHETRTPDAEWFELLVIHHTDCGSGLLADPGLRHDFAQRGFDEQQLAAMPVLDPAETVRADVAKLVAAPQISRQIALTGFSYDLKTGLLSEVVLPAH